MESCLDCCLVKDICAPQLYACRSMMLQHAHHRTTVCKACTQGRMPQRAERNPQTVAFLEMLGVPYDLDHMGSAASALGAPAAGKYGVLYPSFKFGLTGTLG